MGLYSFFKSNEKASNDEIEKYHIDINTSKCDICEKCIIACPNNVLYIKDGACCIRDSQVCKNCRICMAICPNECIKVN